MNRQTHWESVYKSKAPDAVMQRCMLFDTGPDSRIWLDNARRLGIDLSTIECVFLSHWHFDHSGAFPEVIAAISAARAAAGLSQPVIDLHPNRPDQRGLLLPSGVILLLPQEPTFDTLAQAGGEILTRDNPHPICDGFFFGSGAIDRVTEYETGFASHLSFRGDVCEPDPLIMDERFVAAYIPDRGVTVFSACSHARHCQCLPAGERALRKCPDRRRAGWIPSGRQGHGTAHRPDSVRSQGQNQAPPCGSWALHGLARQGEARRYLRPRQVCAKRRWHALPVKPRSDIDAEVFTSHWSV